ncbi:YhgE/Pip domain-containing protein [Corynebacterium nuruki]|uniref:YhgE/Pip domain-containing protein n=1 Tax=Corynebacterium nuruki TaxID=1032851 RepID=UPI002FE07F70
MTASWRVFIRDLARLWRTPKVWVIVVGVMITPALYSWFNVAAFWDPYENTGHIGVAVVNEDEGGSSSLTGPLDVGSQLTDQLADNDRLDWRFMDRDEADDQIRRGDVYATVTVPADFTADILSMFQGTYSQPTLTYRVNEKKSAIGPKITDQGATTLDETINSVVKEKIARVVTDRLRTAGGTLQGDLTGAGQGVAGAFDETTGTLSAARDEFTRIRDSLGNARPTITKTQDALRSVDTTLGDAATALGQVQSVMGTVQKQVADFSGAATDAYVGTTDALADGTAQADAAVAGVTGELERAGAGIGTATREASGLVDQGDRAVRQLRQLLGDASLPPAAAQPLRDALADLEDRTASDRELLDGLSGLQDDASASLDAVHGASDALARATGDTRDRARGLKDSVGDSLPALNAAISRVSSTAGGFAASLQSQQTLVRQSVGLLDGVGRQLDATGGVLDRVGGEFSGIADGLATARTDVLALVAASRDGVLGTVTSLDSVGVSRFVSTPAEVDSHPVYPVDHYGSGMAALFTNLSLWIGAFMLMIIFRTEVDTAGIRRLTVGQAYRGRLLLLAALAVGQGLIVGIGDLLIGVETVNPAAFVGTVVLTGLAYLGIVYGLVSAFGHIGRGIAVVLAFLQIPGASGIYPIEMTPDFFRAISPFLPFTYGIDALRETIGGFYGDHWWRATGILVGMALVAVVAGALLSRRLSHVKALVNGQLKAGGLITNEEVQVVGSSYRLTDVIHALRDRDGYREEVDRQWRPVREHYPALLRTTIAVGVAGVLVLGVLARVIDDQKALFFGLVSLWLLLTVAVIAGLEYMRQSFARARELSELPTADLQDALTDGSDGTDGKDTAS